jgi:hypothetical protein
VLILTCRGEPHPPFGQHAPTGYHHPPDYWRFSFVDMHALFWVAGLHVQELVHDPQDPGVFAVGTRA